MSSASDIAAPKLRPIDEGLRSRGIQVFYTTWLRWIRKKGLPAKKVGGRYYIDLAELDRWIANQSVMPRPASVSGVAPSAMRPRAAEAVLAARRTRGKGAPRQAEGGRL